MTKEFINSYIQHLKKLEGIARLAKSPMADEYRDLSDYLSQNPVMQEGKGCTPVIENKTKGNVKPFSGEGTKGDPPPPPIPSRLPVDDEQPEGKWYTTGASLRICPTCFKEYACLTTGSQDCPNCTPPLRTS